MPAMQNHPITLTLISLLLCACGSNIDSAKVLPANAPTLARAADLAKPYVTDVTAYTYRHGPDDPMLLGVNYFDHLGYSSSTVYLLDDDGWMRPLHGPLDANLRRPLASEPQLTGVPGARGLLSYLQQKDR